MGNMVRGIYSCIVQIKSYLLLDHFNLDNLFTLVKENQTWFLLYRNVHLIWELFIYFLLK